MACSPSCRCSLAPFSLRDTLASWAGSFLDKIVNWGSLIGNIKPVSYLATLCVRRCHCCRCSYRDWGYSRLPCLRGNCLLQEFRALLVSDADKEICTPQGCLFRGRLSYIRHMWSDSECGHEKARPGGETQELMEYWVVHGFSQQVAPWLQNRSAFWSRSALPVWDTALCLHPGKEDKCFPSAVGYKEIALRCWIW